MTAADHDFYLWLAYGASGLLLAAELLLLRRRYKRAQAIQRSTDA